MFIIGIATIFTYAIFTSIALFIYPGGISPLTHWVSQLGNPQENPSGAIFYNFGIGLTAIGVLVFAIELRRWNTGNKIMKVLLSVAQSLCVLITVFLILAAIFPLGPTGGVHALWAGMLGVCVGAFFPISVVALLFNRVFNIWIAGFAFITILVGFIYRIFLHISVLEWVLMVMFLTYFLLVAINSRKLSNVQINERGKSLAERFLNQVVLRTKTISFFK